jgi:hypothetical protein
MNKTLIAILILILGIAFINCNGDSGRPDASTPQTKVERNFSVGQLVRVGKDIPDLPRWVYTTSGIEDFAGKKVFFTVGKADGTNPNEATTSARAAAYSNIAESVKVTVVKQFAEAWESYGKSSQGDFERVRQGLVATKCEETISGAREMSSFVDQVAEVKEVDEDGDTIKKLSPSFYMAYVKMGINYNDYEKLAKGFISDVKKSQPLNSRQKKLMKKAEKTLMSMDKKRDYNLENKPEDEFSEEAKTERAPVVIKIGG